MSVGWNVSSCKNHDYQDSGTALKKSQHFLSTPQRKSNSLDTPFCSFIHEFSKRLFKYLQCIRPWSLLATQSLMKISSGNGSQGCIPHHSIRGKDLTHYCSWKAVTLQYSLTPLCICTGKTCLWEGQLSATVTKALRQSA